MFILSFFNCKFDKSYSKKQINWQEKRYEQIEYLVDCGLLNPWCQKMLDVSGPLGRHLQIPLEALGNILECGEHLKQKSELKENAYALMIEQLRGLDKVEYE